MEDTAKQMPEWQEYGFTPAFPLLIEEDLHSLTSTCLYIELFFFLSMLPLHIENTQTKLPHPDLTKPLCPDLASAEERRQGCIVSV